LPGQMQDLCVVLSQLGQPIEHFLCPIDFESRSKRPTGIHQRHQVLRVFPDRRLEQVQGVIETAGLPKSPGLTHLGHIDPQSADDGWGPGSGWPEVGRDGQVAGLVHLVDGEGIL